MAKRETKVKRRDREFKAVIDRGNRAMKEALAIMKQLEASSEESSKLTQRRKK